MPNYRRGMNPNGTERRTSLAVQVVTQENELELARSKGWVCQTMGMHGHVHCTHAVFCWKSYLSNHPGVLLRGGALSR